MCSTAMASRLGAMTARGVPLVLEPHGRREGASRSSFAPILTIGFVHDFRRTAARNLIRAGVPASIACQLVGWKTLAMLDRYDIRDEEDLRVGAAIDNNARGGNRTHTPLPGRDFESRASTSFTTRAMGARNIARQEGFAKSGDRPYPSTTSSGGTARRGLFGNPKFFDQHAAPRRDTSQVTSQTGSFTCYIAFRLLIRPANTTS